LPPHLNNHTQRHKQQQKQCFVPPLTKISGSVALSCRGRGGGESQGTLPLTSSLLAALPSPCLCRVCRGFCSRLFCSSLPSRPSPHCRTLFLVLLGTLHCINLTPLSYSPPSLPFCLPRQSIPASWVRKSSRPPCSLRKQPPQRTPGDTCQRRRACRPPFFFSPPLLRPSLPHLSTHTHTHTRIYAYTQKKKKKSTPYSPVHVCAQRRRKKNSNRETESKERSGGACVHDRCFIQRHTILCRFL
jgi:hypothetical protein